MEERTRRAELLLERVASDLDETKDLLRRSRLCLILAVVFWIMGLVLAIWT